MAASRPELPLARVVRVVPGATCADQGALIEHVSAWLGEGRVDARLRIEVDGDPSDPLTVTFRLRRDGIVIAQRTFAPAPSRCDHFHAALGLAVALALKAQLIDEIVGDPSFLAAPRRLSLGAEVRAAWNVLPGAALGGGASVEYPLGRGFFVRAGAFGLAAWPQPLGDSGGEFSSTLVAAFIDGCVTLFAVPDAVLGRACIGFNGGALRAAGSGFDVPKAQVLSWFAVSPTLAFSFPLASRWSLDASASLVLPLQATQFAVRSSVGASVAGREADPLGLSASLGPRYEF